MTMNARIRSFLLTLDRLIAGVPFALRGENGVLLSFLFHSLYQGSDEPRADVIDPQQEVTVEMFRRFIDHFQRHSYTFVSQANLVRGLRPGGRYVFVTFDDGYYNNVRALPVLNEFNVPATFFISTNYVKEGKAFWWDAARRETCKRGTPKEKVDRLFADLKRLRTTEAEAHLKKEFGDNALQPVSDLDRPFTPAELRDFARHPLVSFGNHTCDHAILPNYSSDEARAQIQTAQDDIFAMTAKRAEMIAYPNGDESPAVVDVARGLGLRLGLGVEPGRNRLPLELGSVEAMTLKRFTLDAGSAIEAQCRMSRSSLSLYRSARNAKLKTHASFSRIGRSETYAKSPIRSALKPLAE
jgi:peptidoglycan/xylan/chitin deacetylase (PgdA/CDA1 family)